MTNRGVNYVISLHNLYQSNCIVMLKLRRKKWSIDNWSILKVEKNDYLTQKYVTQIRNSKQLVIFASLSLRVKNYKIFIQNLQQVKTNNYNFIK